MSDERNLGGDEGWSGAPPPVGRAEAAQMTILGVDWGRRRIGLAIKPAGQDWPLPRTTLTVGGEAQAVEALRRAIADSGAQAVVIGLPIHPLPEQAREIRRFCRKTRQGMAGVRWFFVDEAFTSQAAEALDRQAGGGRGPSDDLAAALILETFMQRCR